MPAWFYIGKLRHLRKLSINYNISNDALAAIEGLVELEEFWGPVKINDAGLHHLRNMTNMRRLLVGSRLITDDGLRSIRGFIHLEELRLEFSKITDKGMEFVGEMRGLKELYLDGTKVTDAGMKPVTNLKHLRILGCRRHADRRRGPGAHRHSPRTGVPKSRRHARHQRRHEVVDEAELPLRAQPYRDAR